MILRRSDKGRRFISLQALRIGGLSLSLFFVIYLMSLVRGQEFQKGIGAFLGQSTRTWIWCKESEEIALDLVGSSPGRVVSVEQRRDLCKIEFYPLVDGTDLKARIWKPRVWSVKQGIASETLVFQSEAEPEVFKIRGLLVKSPTLSNKFATLSNNSMELQRADK